MIVVELKKKKIMVKNDFKISQVALLALICDLILDDSCTLSSCEIRSMIYDAMEMIG